MFNQQTIDKWWLEIKKKISGKQLSTGSFY